MTIDARKLEHPELFIKLKETLSLHCGREVSVSVLHDSRNTVERVRAFASMSGCRTNVEEKEGYYVVQITGNPCCV